MSGRSSTCSRARPSSSFRRSPGSSSPGWRSPRCPGSRCWPSRRGRWRRARCSRSRHPRTSEPRPAPPSPPSSGHGSPRSWPSPATPSRPLWRPARAVRAPWPRWRSISTCSSPRWCCWRATATRSPKRPRGGERGPGSSGSTTSSASGSSCSGSVSMRCAASMRGRSRRSRPEPRPAMRCSTSSPCGWRRAGVGPGRTRRTTSPRSRSSSRLETRRHAYPTVSRPSPNRPMPTRRSSSSTTARPTAPRSSLRSGWRTPGR